MSKGLLPLVLALGVAFASPLRRAEASGSVSISFFYDELRPHGDWVTVGRYGHCWRPRGIDRDWQPYLNGEWLYTEDGWTWVSYDSWGGDPWAPVPPSFSIGVSGYLGPPVTVSRSSYVFVPATRFVGVNVGTVRVPVTQNAILLARTRPVTRFAASGGVLTSGGPTVVQVERATQRKIARVSVGDAHTKAVPLHAGLRGRRGTVIAPAAERARFIASPAPHAAKVAHETAKAPRQSAAVKHEGSQVAHEKAQVAHARTTEPAASIAKPATPARERHDAPAPRVEAVPPPHGHEPVVTSSASQAPPPEAAPPQHAERHQTDAAPPQGGKAHAPKNEHGREKGE